MSEKTCDEVKSVLENEQIKHQKGNLDLFQTLSKGQTSMLAIMHDLKHSQAKNNMIMYIIIFLGGIVIGTQYQSWIPYLDNLLSAVKNTNQLRNIAK